MPDKVVSIPTDTAKGFEFIRACDFVGNVKPVSWAVRRIIEANSLTLLFGDPESGKSLVAMDMSLCTTANLQWHGHSVNQGAVFYIAGEGHNGLARRINAWLIRNQQKVDSLPFYVSECAASLYNHESAVEVCDAIQSLATHSSEKPVLIVIDTLARNFGPASENSTEDMNQFIAHVDKIREQFKAAVLIVHHTGHGDKSRARGAYALTGAMDAEYRLEKGDDGTVRMTCTKAKDFSRPVPLAFKIRPVELGIEDEDGEPVVSVVLDSTDYVLPQKPVAKLGKRQRDLMTLFTKLLTQDQQRLAENGLPADSARVARADLKDSAFDSGIVRSRQSFSDGLKRLVDANLLVDDGIFLTNNVNT